jgi:hypothetical protein
MQTCRRQRKTFGVTIDSTVLEFVRRERLAWDAHYDGVHADHAWGFERRDGSVYVLTGHHRAPIDAKVRRSGIRFHNIEICRVQFA